MAAMQFGKLLWFAEFPRFSPAGRIALMETISMNVVPFTFQTGGFSDFVYEGRGLLKDEGDYLTLEFQQQDVWFGAFKSAVQSIRVPVNEIVSLELTKGWLGAYSLCAPLMLQTTNMQLLDDLPAASQGRVRLKIARKDIEAAERFVEDFHDRHENL
jgi:hypothetical protein